VKKRPGGRGEKRRSHRLAGFSLSDAPQHQRGGKRGKNHKKKKKKKRRGLGIFNSFPSGFPKAVGKGREERKKVKKSRN